MKAVDGEVIIAGKSFSVNVVDDNTAVNPPADPENPSTVPGTETPSGDKNDTAP